MTAPLHPADAPNETIAQARQLLDHAAGQPLERRVVALEEVHALLAAALAQVETS